MRVRFIEWLKDSGTTTEEGVRILDSLNPFEMIIENPNYPFARIARESFWVGLRDTYDIFVGHHFFPHPQTGEYHKGLLDLLIFPTLSRRLLNNINFEETQNFHSFLFSSFVGPLIFIIELLRAILGASLTLAVSPVVALVHIFTYFVAQVEQKKYAVAGLRTHPPEEEQLQPHVDRPELFLVTKHYQYLQQHPLNEFTIEPALIDESFTLNLWWETKQEGGYICRYLVALIEMTPENEKGLQAMLSLNLFDAAAQLENSGWLEDIEEMIKWQTSVEKAVTKTLEKQIPVKDLLHLTLFYAGYANRSQKENAEKLIEQNIALTNPSL